MFHKHRNLLSYSCLNWSYAAKCKPVAQKLERSNYRLAVWPK